MPAVLFDLDDTLVNTSNLRQLRDARKWKDCVAAVGRTAIFPGVAELLRSLASDSVGIGIVTTSVSFYAEAMLRHHAIPYNALIAFHDAIPTKPHPKCVQLAMQRLKIEPSDAIGVGDSLHDAQAFRAAGVVAYGAGWSPLTVQSAGWSEILPAPADILARLPGR